MDIMDAQQQFFSNHKLPQLVVQSSKHQMIAVDKDCRIIGFNQTAFSEVKRVLGKELVLGMPFQELANNASYHQKSLEYFGSAMRGEIITVRTQYTERDDSMTTKHYEIHFCPLLDDGNEDGTHETRIIGAYEVVLDISKVVEQAV